MKTDEMSYTTINVGGKKQEVDSSVEFYSFQVNKTKLQNELLITVINKFFSSEVLVAVFVTIFSLASLYLISNISKNVNEILDVVKLLSPIVTGYMGYVFGKSSSEK